MSATSQTSHVPGKEKGVQPVPTTKRNVKKKEKGEQLDELQPTQRQANLKKAIKEQEEGGEQKELGKSQQPGKEQQSLAQQQPQEAKEEKASPA